MTEQRAITTETIIWQGVTIEIAFEPDWLDMAEEFPDFRTAHLEIRAMAPERAPLPITETGYRSHFTHPDVIAEAGGPAAFVIAWLDHDAKQPEWLKREAEARQLNLF